MHYYYYSINKRYNVSNFSAGGMPILKKAAIAGALSLPLVGATAGYIYGGKRHEHKLNELNNKLAKATDPYEQAQIQEEINRLHKGNFLKRAGAVGAGLVAGSSIQGVIGKPLFHWVKGS